MSVPWVRAAAVAVVAAMSLVGCAGVDAPGTGGTSGGAGDPTEDAPGAGEPLLQVERSGGFVLVGTDFASVPELTVYPDGTAILHGPQIAIFPPPALPSLVRRVLGDDDVDALVAAARDAGLLSGTAPAYGVPPVADAPTTVVTLRVAGRTSTHSAEALGHLDGTEGVAGGDGSGGVPTDELPTDGTVPGLTQAERDARVHLATFIARAHEVVGAAGADEPYGLDAFAVMARPVPEEVVGDGGAAPGTGDGATVPSGPAPDDGTEPQVLAWPLRVALADAADCVLVDGAAARTLRDALSGASSTTRFEQAGVRYDVWLRPLLPHEEGCGDV